MVSKGGRFELPPRPEAGRLIAGVAIGLSHRLSLDVTLVRLAFLVLALAWGLGAVIYAGLWLLLPDESLRSAAGFRDVARKNLAGARRELRGAGGRLRGAWARSEGATSWPRPLDRRWIAIVLMVAGLGVLLSSFGVFSWLTPARAVGLALVAFGAAVFGSVGGMGGTGAERMGGARAGRRSRSR